MTSAVPALGHRDHFQVRVTSDPTPIDGGSHRWCIEFINEGNADIRIGDVANRNLLMTNGMLLAKNQTIYDDCSTDPWWAVTINTGTTAKVSGFRTT